MTGRNGQHFIHSVIAGVFVPLVKMIQLSQSVRTAATTGADRRLDNINSFFIELKYCRYVFSAKGEVKKDVYEQFLDIVG